MTLIKKKITEIESIVNKADNRKTAGKIYLPKDWIGKRVKTILLSSLIAMAIVVITQQQANALILKEFHNNMYELADQLKVKLHICNRDLLNEHAANTGYGFDLKRVEKFNECDEVANLITYLV